MADFTLDTSGAVGPLYYERGEQRVPGFDLADRQTSHLTWSDLSPFEQGYAEGLFAELRDGSTFADEALKKMSPDLREQKKALATRCHWSRHPAWQSRCDQMVLLSLVAVVARAAGDTVTEPTREGRKVLSLLVGFSDLHPETLNRIRTDCAAFGKTWRMTEPERGLPPGAMGGRDFWDLRQAGKLTDPPFPRLSLALDDAGKVVFS